MFKQRRCVSCGARDWSPCAECIDKFKPAPSLSIDGARTTSAIAVFEGPARDVIHAFKYHNARSLAKWFAPALVAGLAADIDLVTWAPTTKRRRRHRGYDQAELLARAVGRLTELRCQATIRRLDDHSAQTATPPDSRRKQPEFAAIGRTDSRCVGLIDDVLTTGTTIGSAVRCLRSSGAAAVDVLVLARTPAPNDARALSPRPRSELE